MTGKPRQQRESYEGKRALNQHLHRHHGGPRMSGDLQERLAQHDELHWWARKTNVDLGHTHLPYQDGETQITMAQRLLAEGTAAQTSSE